MVLAFHQKKKTNKQQNRNQKKNKQTNKQQNRNQKKKQTKKATQKNRRVVGSGMKEGVGYIKPLEAVTVEEAVPYMFETVNDPALLGI